MKEVLIDVLGVIGKRFRQFGVPDEQVQDMLERSSDNLRMGVKSDGAIFIEGDKAKRYDDAWVKLDQPIEQPNSN